MKPIIMINTEKGLPFDYFDFNEHNVIHDILFSSDCESWVGYFEWIKEDDEYYFTDYFSHDRSKVEDVEIWGKIEYDDRNLK